MEKNIEIIRQVEPSADIPRVIGTWLLFYFSILVDIKLYCLMFTGNTLVTHW